MENGFASLWHSGRKETITALCGLLWHVGESQMSITGLRLSGHKQKDRKRHWGGIIHLSIQGAMSPNKPHVKYVCFDTHWYPKSYGHFPFWGESI